MFDRDQVHALRTLIAAYVEEHDFDADDDQDATHEVLETVRRLADVLESQLKSQEGAEPPAEYAIDKDDIPF